jgi:hypothetical protein
MADPVPVAKQDLPAEEEGRPEPALPTRPRKASKKRSVARKKIRAKTLERNQADAEDTSDKASKTSKRRGIRLKNIED